MVGGGDDELIGLDIFCEHELAGLRTFDPQVVGDLAAAEQIADFRPNDDVTVLGSVASGAEIVAGGSIHVYGALRGRAMAGASGNNRQARIFCTKIEAELLAIDGFYRTIDELDANLCGKPVQAFLDGETLMVTALG